MLKQKKNGWHSKLSASADLTGRLVSIYLKTILTEEEEESCSHERDQRREWNQGHYSFLREVNYIYILKKVLKWIEGGGWGQVEVGRWLPFTSRREVNESKGHFRVQSGQRIHSSICPCLQTQRQDRSAGQKSPNHGHKSDIKILI